MGLYRRKPSPVRAVRYIVGETSLDDIYRELDLKTEMIYIHRTDLWVMCSDGTHPVASGDWVIATDDDLDVMSDGLFRGTYEKVREEI